MEINLGEERIIELRTTYTEEQVRGLALAKRVDAFGQMAKLFQRPKPEDIEITSVQKRYEPFWHAEATSRYTYDRRKTYGLDVAPEVRSVTISGTTYPVPEGSARSIEVEAVDHCVDEEHRDVVLDPVRGEDAPEMRKYLTFESVAVDDLARLAEGETVVVPPTVLGSFVVRKLASSMLKAFHADLVQDERIEVEHVTLYYRPLYAVEYFWKAKDRRQVLDFDALTGDSRAEATQVKRHVMRALDNDALFDIGADTIGMLVPGSGVAIKVGRVAARRALR